MTNQIKRPNYRRLPGLPLFGAVVAILLTISACSAPGASDSTSESGGDTRTTSRADSDEKSKNDSKKGDDKGPTRRSPRPTTPTPPSQPKNAVNPRVDPSSDNLSTFALDVDTGSYTLGRNQIDANRKPLPDDVRVEEYVNFFPQGYDAPTEGSFAIHADGGPTPFLESGYQLLRIGVQSQHVDNEERPDARLTFVIDVSGSMRSTLPDVKEALRVLVTELRPTDEVAIVTYGSDARTLAPHTPVEEKETLFNAIEDLESEGSTNAQAGLKLGYTEAEQVFLPAGINRVILLSDGVANVGATDAGSIIETIEDAAGEGINLLTVGFGDGAYNDTLMEQLADSGDGFYVFIDGRDEAIRVFRDQLATTLLTIANDAKIQVAFNADTVAEYRLIGFENRAIDDDDFDEDVDAGEIGAGHTVVALYEVKVGSASAGETLAQAELRWTDPETGEDQELSQPIFAEDLAGSYEDTAARFQMTATVAAWAEVLRESPFATDNRDLTLDTVADEAARLSDGPLAEDSDVADFARLAQRSASLR